MRHKFITALIIWLGLFPTLLIVGKILRPLINNFSPVTQLLITTLIVVPLMVFFVIPFVTRIFKKLKILK